MANKLISEIGLPQSVANIFAARNILTAKDALSMPDTDLMILLDVGIGDVAAAVSRISEVACPPHQTALSLMEERVRSELYHGHLPTRLVGLDAALCGGIPFGAVTELVGPSGIGKTQISGARIKVSDRSDFIPGTSDRKVMITGRREAICVAEDMIMDIVESISQS